MISKKLDARNAVVKDTYKQPTTNNPPLTIPLSRLLIEKIVFASSFKISFEFEDPMP